ncbi:MAG: hypothetical protein MZV70_10965 [Desulfobacterales bacterium]|nr:hypothetical protein [Desulfobacterales bacterium]
MTEDGMFSHRRGPLRRLLRPGAGPHGRRRGVRDGQGTAARDHRQIPQPLIRSGAPRLLRHDSLPALRGQSRALKAKQR